MGPSVVFCEWALGLRTTRTANVTQNAEKMVQSLIIKYIFSLMFTNYRIYQSELYNQYINRVLTRYESIVAEKNDIKNVKHHNYGIDKLIH